MVQTGGVKAEGGQQEILLPPPLKDIQFYGSLTPDTAQPYLAISGIGDCKGYWIGALPVPPEEPEHIHMPSPSWKPMYTTGSVALILVGFLVAQVNPFVGFGMSICGGLLTILNVYLWVDEPV